MAIGAATVGDDDDDDAEVTDDDDDDAEVIDDDDDDAEVTDDDDAEVTDDDDDSAAGVEGSAVVEGPFRAICRSRPTLVDCCKTRLLKCGKLPVFAPDFQLARDDNKRLGAVAS